ncbi:MAG: hypothetical protein JW797_11455 [Bradymonadales bacterium]|nr:hypothetical protein [Bradymonadales bacterium]
MANIFLPTASSTALLNTQPGLVWRLLVRAARSGSWELWREHLDEELAAGRTDAQATVLELAGGAVPLVEVLGGMVDTPEALDQLGRLVVCGLGYYLEALSPPERIRSTPRLARLLHEVDRRLGTSLYAHLDTIPGADQASIWDAVLSMIAALDAAGEPLSEWLTHVSHLPETLLDRWRDQLPSLQLTVKTQEQLEQMVGAGTPPPPPDRSLGQKDEEEELEVVLELAEPFGTPALAQRPEQTPGTAPPKAGGLMEPATISSGGVMPIRIPRSKPAKPEPSRAATTGEPAPPDDSPSAGGMGAAEDFSRPVTPLFSGVSVIERTEPPVDSQPAVAVVADEQTVTSKALPRTGRLPADEDQRQIAAPLEVDLPGEQEIEEDRTKGPTLVEEPVTPVAARQPGSEEKTVLSGGWAGKPCPRVIRVLEFITGIIIVVSIVRVLGRFLFGLRRVGRIWMEGEVVFVETSRHFLGKEVRRTRRTFGPRGILTVQQEVRYPFLYLFIGLLAVCAGALVGTMVYLDGRLAGFEDWMEVGLYLLMGGVVIDFLLTVLVASRPGRTSLSITFEPKTTIRLIGVNRVEAERLMVRLARAAHAG